MLILFVFLLFLLRAASLDFARISGLTSVGASYPMIPLVVLHLPGLAWACKAWLTYFRAWEKVHMSAREATERWAENYPLCVRVFVCFTNLCWAVY